MTRIDLRLKADANFNLQRSPLLALPIDRPFAKLGRMCLYIFIATETFILAIIPEQKCNYKIIGTTTNYTAMSI